MSDDKTSRRKGDIVADWRAQHIGELDRNLATWKAIRDDPDASDKDRIEAAKSIARQLGALSPDKAKEGVVIMKSDGPKLSPGHAKELEDILSKL